MTLFSAVDDCCREVSGTRLDDNQAERKQREHSASRTLHKTFLMLWFFVHAL